MKYLGVESEQLHKLGGYHTAVEIAQQPEIWKKIWDMVQATSPEIVQYLDEALSHSKRIILTGAGTSAFIGITLKSLFQTKYGLITEAIPTTDLVTHPDHYFLRNTPTLLISFARSGNSPESAAAVILANECCDQVYHLIITCNIQGALAKVSSSQPMKVIFLPEESNDQSLAMTSSYTSMLLTGLLIARIHELPTLEDKLKNLCVFAQDFLDNNCHQLEDIAKLDFKRIVFLGSGPFFGTATESSLKIQELTDGEVISKFETYLGFRHGPKSVIDSKTIIVYFLSSQNEHALKYELDLINSMKMGTRPLMEIGISESSKEVHSIFQNYSFGADKLVSDDYLMAIAYVLFAQVLGFYKSVELHLKPDSPSVNNDIARVVEGVHIYALI
ncbi:MAG: SIS domain-containing protein [Saprospiraceae bacterium]|nr:SIS domain-containing protein [Saprospiraceae bacterium]MBP7644055.1 SIS domain-containing protein [Saprospiraceae bacterium]